MISRENYLKQIRPYYHKNIIKIIMGVRRSGKSILLSNIIYDLLKDGVEESHINIIDFDLYDNNKYTNTSNLTKYLKEKIIDGKMYYLFFDEVQNIKDWEKVVGQLSTSNNVSIFVTGSNSDLIDSKKMKYVNNNICFNIFPFSYKELKDKISFEDYLKWGGMPLTINSDSNTKKTYIMDVYNSIIVKDIVNRFNVKDIELLNNIISYILSNISEQFSVTKMAKYFETYDRKISLDTMYNYIDYISRTFMLQKTDRYDVKEDKKLSGKYKYYLIDFNFLNIVNSKPSRKYLLENIVYNELVSNGYKVYQGIVGSKVIDFVAIKGNKKIYIDVYDKLLDISDIDSAYRKFSRIKNAEKYILSLDDKDLSKRDIKHKNILDFLLNKGI